MLQTAREWWERLSPQQQSELFAEVAAYALRTSGARVEIPEELAVRADFAYGVPVYAVGLRRRRYAVVRPCPHLAADIDDPEEWEELVLARSASEARELAEAFPRCYVVDLGLPEHEQLTMC